MTDFLQEVPFDDFTFYHCFNVLKTSSLGPFFDKQSFQKLLIDMFFLGIPIITVSKATNIVPFSKENFS